LLLSEKEILEVIVKHSPKNLHELKLCYTHYMKSGLLISFLTRWANRIPQKSLSLMILIPTYESSTLGLVDESMEVVEKYIKLGIIKEFKFIKDESEDF